jgi:hypothetical protein
MAVEGCGGVRLVRLARAIVRTPEWHLSQCDDQQQNEAGAGTHFVRILTDFTKNLKWGLG